MIQLSSLIKFADSCTNQGLLPDLYAGLRGNKGAGCEVTIDSLRSITVLIGNAIGILLSVAVIVAVGFIMYGGFQYTTSSGDPSGVKKAKETIVNAIIGLVLAMVAFGIVRTITEGFK